MKRNFLRLALAAATVALLAGCASGVRHDQMASSIPSIQAGQGRIYFFRSGTPFGAAVQPDIRLNGQVVGESKPGGFFYVDRPAGRYTATASTETEKALSFSLDPGETKYVRSSVSLGVLVGRVVLDLETPDKARAELGELSYTGTAQRR